MTALGAALVAAARVRGVKLDLLARDPRPAQEIALLRIVRAAERTAFGRDHGFSSIRSVRDFQSRVPLRRYADLAPYLDRVKRGEPDVIWPGKIPYFGMSSGTTSGNKYLPITHAAVRQQQWGGFDPIASYLRWTGDRSLFGGRALLLGGSASLVRHASGALVGDNTGIMASHIPWFVRQRQLPSEPVRLIANWDEKVRSIAREAVSLDVRLVAGTPSWFPGLFDAVIDEARRVGLPSGSLSDVWPNLRLLTGGGVRYEPYRPLIEQRVGAVPYVDVYNATEGGIMAVQDRPNDPGMRLLPDAGVFYELVPVPELERARPTRLPLDEVEEGVTYAIAVTTPSGLFSYLIGDCVRFVERAPHRIVFEGRTAAFMNVAGEHVSQGELERAAARAASELGVALVEMSVGSEVGRDGAGARHVWFVEVEREVSSARFAEIIDGDLRAQNGDYDAHRTSPMGLREPLVRFVPRGTFRELMRVRGKLGGQNKVPRVVEGALRETLERVAAELRAAN